MIPVTWFTAEGAEIELIEPAPSPEPVPEYPAECWQTRPVDGEKAMAAVRALSGG